MSKSVYEMVTDRIIKQLESGIIPWEKPWTGVFCKTFLDKVAKHFWTLLHVHFGHNCKALASVVCASQYSFADII